MKRMGFSARGLLVAGIMAVSCTAAFAESVWVKSEVVEIRAGKGALYDVVAKVKKGQELNVIEKDGRWFKVAVPQSPAKEGYLFENTVSLTKVNGGGGFLSGIGVTGGEMSTGAAAKGLNPAAEDYASTKHMSSAPLNNLVALRKRINPKEWQRFMAEGHVGVQ